MDEKRNNLKPDTLDLFGKIAPQEIEVETAILGALLIDSRAIVEVADKLKTEYFYKHEHQQIYSAIYTLYSTGKSVDLLTVTKQLRTTKQLDTVGGAGYVASLTQKVASSHHVKDHTEIIKNAFIRRQVISTTYEINKRAYEDGVELEELMLTVELLLDNISNATYSGNEIKHVQNVLSDVDIELNRRIKLFKEGKMGGITTGLKKLDELTRGWQNGDLIIEAGRPGMGKTAVSLKHAISAAKAGYSVCFFSMEMKDVRLADRLLIGLSGINADNYRQGNLSENDLFLFQKAKEELAKYPIYIDASPVCSPNYIRAVCKRLKAKGKCDMIIADYLQLMDVETGSNKNSNREQQIARTSRACKLIAKELDIPFILLCQLSRKVEDRLSKKPGLSDLRESGAIEQDADVVLFLYRPEYYGEEGFVYNDENGNFIYGQGFINIAKQREGALMDVPFAYNRSLTQIWDFSESNHTQVVVTRNKNPTPAKPINDFYQSELPY